MSKLEINVIREKAYKDALSKARELIKFNNSRYDIAELSFKVCVLMPGYKPEKNNFSILRFATELDLKYHTLFQWRRQYKIVVRKLYKCVKLNTHMIKLTMKKITLKTHAPTVNKIYYNFLETYENTNSNYFRVVALRTENYKKVSLNETRIAEATSKDLEIIKLNCESIFKSVCKELYRRNQ